MTGETYPLGTNKVQLHPLQQPFCCIPINMPGIPAGPFRETVKDASERADMVVSIVNDEGSAEGSQFAAWLAPMSQPTPERVIAFAGIGHPEKFFSLLVSCGYDVAESIAFPDHHRFRDAELDVLKQKAEHLSAKLVCTEKDYVRLSQSFQADIAFFPVEMRINNPKALTEKLLSCISAHENAL